MCLKHFKCTVNSHAFKCGHMNILSLINLVSNSSFLREKKGFGRRWVEWQIYFLFYIWIEFKKGGFPSRNARTQFKQQKSEDRGYFEPTLVCVPLPFVFLYCFHIIFILFFKQNLGKATKNLSYIPGGVMSGVFLFIWSLFLVLRAKTP